jgi:hypothetical protein
MNLISPGLRIRRRRSDPEADGLRLRRVMSALCDPGRKASDDDRPAAGAGPDPLRAINRDMEMPGAGRHIDRLRAEHGNDLERQTTVAVENPAHFSQLADITPDGWDRDSPLAQPEMFWPCRLDRNSTGQAIVP